jgi:hypothetical protein
MVRAWIAALKAGSRSACSHGYELQWRDINHRQLGRNSIRCVAMIASEADGLRMIGRVNDARRFEERYGLLGKPPLIRFRMLDENHYIGGLSDLTVPVTQFAALRTGVERVFVTENEINALAFPPIRSGMVVLGGGYGIERLTGIGWLHDRDVAYWGDIDTHGFAILDRLRAALPAARSVMMDASTFQAHRHLWGNEDADKRFIGELTRLTAGERELFLALRDNVIGERLRLEQERIAYAWVTSAIEQI